MWGVASVVVGRRIDSPEYKSALNRYAWVVFSGLCLIPCSCSATPRSVRGAPRALVPWQFSSSIVLTRARVVEMRASLLAVGKVAILCDTDLGIQSNKITRVSGLFYVVDSRISQKAGIQLVVVNLIIFVRFKQVRIYNIARDA